jgi:cytidine deaminase
MDQIPFSALPERDCLLLHEAEKMLVRAYNPYSKFYVGAALRTPEGAIIGGANVENAAYGSTICAERAAILHANARDRRVFDAIAIITKGDKFDTEDVSGPCGSCRQMLFESRQVGNIPMRVIMANTKKTLIVVSSIDELLPLAFGPRDLGIDVEKYR